MQSKSNTKMRWKTAVYFLTLYNRPFHPQLFSSPIRLAAHLHYPTVMLPLQGLRPSPFWSMGASLVWSLKSKQPWTSFCEADRPTAEFSLNLVRLLFHAVLTIKRTLKKVMVMIRIESRVPHSSIPHLFWVRYQSHDALMPWPPPKRTIGFNG